MTTTTTNKGKEITLVVSSRMDGNKKGTRNETNLIRLPKLARDHLNLDEFVSISQKIKGGKSHTPFQLRVFQAFSSDIDDLKGKGIPAEDLKSVGFVTSSVFNKICGNVANNTVLISSSLENTMIGADPEFLLFDDDGNIIEANRIMPKEGMVGSDGPMAEIRPLPACNPFELVSNIRSILTNPNVTKQIQKYKWLAACYYKSKTRDYSVGGHIHIGNPPQIMSLERDKRENLYHVLNKILDELLSVPMVKVDGKKEGSSRRVGAMFKFGSFGCLRTDWDRLEHRTLSGLWLMHPQLAEMVIGTAKAITDSAFKMVISNGLSPEFVLPQGTDRKALFNKGFDGWKNIPLANEMSCIAPSTLVRELLDKSAASAITHKYLDNWKDRMSGLPAYDTYSEYIIGLYKLLKHPAKFFFDCNRDLQENWGNNKSLI